MAGQRSRHYGAIRRLPSGRFQARYRDPLTGKRLSAPETFRTKGDASRWLARLEGGSVDPAHVAAAKADRRVGEYAAEWIETRPVRPRTRELYALQLRLHIVPTLGDARLDKLEPKHIRAWHAGLSDGHLSAVSVAKVYRLLRSVLTTAVEDGLVIANPCRIKGAGVERSIERPIPTIEEVAMLSDALPPKLAAVPWVAALAGLRKGELFGLSRAHVNVDQLTIRVDRALQEVTGRGAVMVEPKTPASNRVVQIPQALGAILAQHLADYVGLEPAAVIFTNDHGRPIRATVWATAWNRARTETGVDARLHDLRHLAGTMTAQTGATTKEVMARLGHSSIQAAMRYQHAAADRNREIADRLDDLLG